METLEGFESKFALYYLSGHLLSHGLTTRSAVPTAPSSSPSAPRGWAVLSAGTICNCAAATRAPVPSATVEHCAICSASTLPGPMPTPASTMFNHPGVVATSFAGEYDATAAAAVARQIPTDTGAFDARDAARLHEITEGLLSGRR